MIAKLVDVDRESRYENSGMEKEMAQAFGMIFPLSRGRKGKRKEKFRKA